MLCSDFDENLIGKGFEFHLQDNQIKTEKPEDLILSFDVLVPKRLTFNFACKALTFHFHN